MCENLVINPENLYAIYSYKELNEYYYYSFLTEFNSIEIDIFYDVLNCLSIKQLNNLNRYIFKQWKLTIDKIKRESTIKNKLLKKIYSNKHISSSAEFNIKLVNFIDNNKILALFIMNKILLFLYPC
tara:strand:- start:2861 stop:3241 length:381 start_codon:yes stop_codon:yes gene_type:complete